MINTAETARQQGIDLYGEEAKRITTAMEFHAALVLGKPAPPWLGGGQLKIAPAPPGKLLTTITTIGSGWNCRRRRK